MLATPADVSDITSVLRLIYKTLVKCFGLEIHETEKEESLWNLKNCQNKLQRNEFRHFFCQVQRGCVCESIKL